MSRFYTRRWLALSVIFTVMFALVWPARSDVVAQADNLGIDGQTSMDLCHLERSPNLI